MNDEWWEAKKVPASAGREMWASIWPMWVSTAKIWQAGVRVPASKQMCLEGALTTTNYLHRSEGVRQGRAQRHEGDGGDRRGHAEAATNVVSHVANDGGDRADEAQAEKEADPPAALGRRRTILGRWRPS